MNLSHLYHQSLFIIRFRYIHNWINFVRKQIYSLMGMKIGKGTNIPKLYVTWPNQVLLGNGCILEHGIYFKIDGIWKDKPAIIIHDEVFIGSGCEFNISGKVEIGRKAMIASGCRFIDHDHGTSRNVAMNNQRAIIEPIKVEEEVWLGANVIVLKGVSIGKGAVVAAGSVVTKNINEYEIWAGVPAKFIKNRI